MTSWPKYKGCHFS